MKQIDTNLKTKISVSDVLLLLFPLNLCIYSKIGNTILNKDQPYQMVLTLKEIKPSCAPYCVNVLIQSADTSYIEKASLLGI